MLRNILKVAARTMFRNKVFALINICGLAIGMAGSLLILLWVQNELSFDAFYPFKDRLFKAWNKDKGPNGTGVWDTTPKIMGPALKEEYPEVEQSARVNWDEYYYLSSGGKKLYVEGNMVDPEFLTMFSFPLLRGNPKTALNNPTDILITETLSWKMFGTAEAMGRTLLIDNKYPFQVSGILKDLPNNTQFKFEWLVNWDFVATTGQDDSSWSSNSTQSYVLLKPGVDVDAFNRKLAKVLQNHLPTGKTTAEIWLYPMRRMHLYNNFENGVQAGGQIERVRIFLVIASFILLIACINFMNLTTAHSEKRAKEVGIRKTMGSGRGALIGQFLSESLLISTVAALLAVALVQLCLPMFNEVVGKRLQIEYGNALFWLSLLVFTGLTGVLAGSYPALFLSAYRPALVLKGTFRHLHERVNLRRALVVVQFTFAIVLVVCTLIIRQQSLHAQERDTGYERNDLLYVPMVGDIQKNYALIRSELLQRGVAESMTKSSAPFTEAWSSGGANWEGMGPDARNGFQFFYTDQHIVKTAGLTLAAGRDIDLDTYPTDSSGIILNEAAVKMMGKSPAEAVGLAMHMGDDDKRNWRVVGVVKDFILQSPYQEVNALLFVGPWEQWYNVVHIRQKPGRSTAENLAAMEKVFRKYNPLYSFDYYFVDQKYAEKFKSVQATATLTGAFALLTIFISCLGLYGLTAFMAERRTKEIGIRKVLGATVSGIVLLLSKDFVQLVVTAFAVASPIAWWVMSQWLSTYSYRIEITGWVFALAGLAALLIALGTTSVQALRAALTNPVRSLRTE